MRRSLIILIALIVGCNGHPSPTVTVTQTAAVTPSDFALDTVVGLLSSGVTDGPSLEARINDPSSGINNVDIDKDGSVDYVNVLEAPIPSGKKMELVAHSSSGTAPDTSIAAIRFAPGAAGVDVQAGYAPLIDPSGRYYYRSSMASDLAFAAWLFMPYRPVYVSRVPVGYSYRKRVPVTTLTQTRTTYTKTTKVAPIVAAPRPADFNAARLTSPPRPEQTSRSTATPAPASTTFAQASRDTSSFKVDTRSKPAATGFGATPSPAKASSPSPAKASPSRGKVR